MKKVALLCTLLGVAVMFTACAKKEESKTVETTETTAPADNAAAPADTVTESTTTTSTPAQ